MNEFTLECDEAKAEERQVENNQRISEQRLDLKAVMSTPEGVRVLCRILGFAHLHKTSLSANGTYETIRLEGERNVGLRLLQAIKDADSMLAKDVMTKLLEE